MKKLLPILFLFIAAIAISAYAIEFKVEKVKMPKVPTVYTFNLKDINNALLEAIKKKYPNVSIDVDPASFCFKDSCGNTYTNLSDTNGYWTMILVQEATFVTPKENEHGVPIFYWNNSNFQTNSYNKIILQ